MNTARIVPSGFWGRFYRAFRFPILFAIFGWIVGTLGYWQISGYQATLLDCAYMTFITVASIGFAEIIDLSASPGGRVFTMVIGTVGILNVTYIASKLTAFIVESQFDQVIRRRKMQDAIDALSGHYIICGLGRVGGNVAHELQNTERPYVGVEDAPEALAAFRERFPGALAFHGDTTDDDALHRAGIERATGLFAVTGDDGKNLLITLTAKQLNPRARVVARCHEVRNIDKLKRIGADAIVSPDFTGGMRMAASMIRPAVVTFLDEMLRSEDKLRVEEIEIGKGVAPRNLADAVPASREYVVLAVRMAGSWQFNPPPDFTLQPGNTLVVMTTPQGRHVLETALAT